MRNRHHNKWQILQQQYCKYSHVFLTKRSSMYLFSTGVRSVQMPTAKVLGSDWNRNKLDQCIPSLNVKCDICKVSLLRTAACFQDDFLLQFMQFLTFNTINYIFGFSPTGRSPKPHIPTWFGPQTASESWAGCIMSKLWLCPAWGLVLAYWTSSSWQKTWQCLCIRNLIWNAEEKQGKENG